MAAQGMMQCHRCGRKGHTAKNCSRPPDCFRCGQPHYARDCPSAPRPACYKCGRTSHLARDCPAGINCYKCGQVGHFAKDCTSSSQRGGRAQNRREEPVITASQLPPVFCAHCKRRGHTATQCTAGELQEYDDFKDSLKITPDMLLLGNVKRKRPADAEEEEGKKGDKKRVTTQILIVPKQKKGKVDLKEETRAQPEEPKPKQEAAPTGSEKDSDEESGGGLFALMASYGDSEDKEENESNHGAQLEENGSITPASTEEDVSTAVQSSTSPTVTT